MALIIPNSSQSFTPAPEGLHAGVLVDTIDLGMIDGKFGKKRKVVLRWQIAQINPETKKRYIAQKRYTASLHKKSSLRKDLETWRGKALTKEECENFDLEKLIGKNGQLQISHTIGDDGTKYGNINAVVPLGAGMARLAPLDYEREKDRTDAPAGKADVGPAHDADDAAGAAW